LSFDKNSTAAQVIAGHDLTGTDAVVTGGARGLGAETARVLAAAGARVVLAGRDQARGEAAAAQMRAGTGNRGVEFRGLDLGSLASVREFAAGYLSAARPLHLLVNNAGVMATPLTRTADGFESQFGINHLGTSRSRGRRIRGPLLIGTGVLLSASAALLTVGAGAAVVVLITVGVLFGIPNGLNVVANQAAMYRQAPAGQPGVASGLFRTAQYIGAIFAASLIGLVYGRHASDGGLHGLALAFLALSAVLLGGTVLDPTIRRRDSAVQTATGTPPGAGASGTRNLRSGGRAGTAEREKR